MISEKKFIELLNLYIDHEISAEEVRILEAEILRNPARHTIYRQYCAMHKGCLELARTFAPHSEMAAARSAPASPREAIRDREAPSTLRDKFGWGSWVGGLGLAAACGALVFFVFSHKHRNAPAGSDGITTFAPALLAAPLSVPLNVPTPSPVASAPHFRDHAGEARALLGGGVDNTNLAKHAFVTTAAAMSVPAPVADYPYPAHSQGGPRRHSVTISHFPVSYTAGPSATESGHLDWGPLVNLREIIESETMSPAFQVRPAVAPSPRVYRRQEGRFEGGRVEMTRFQFQR